MDQLPLDFAARARSTDRGTSHAAARGVDGTSLAGKVLEELRKNGPGTTHALADRLGLSLVTVSPRMAPLERKGFVAACGKEGNRTIWRAT